MNTCTVAAHLESSLLLDSISAGCCFPQPLPKGLNQLLRHQHDLKAGKGTQGGGGGHREGGMGKGMCEMPQPVCNAI
jgi:hypothetical protein